MPNRLFTPWRLPYILGFKDQENSPHHVDGCLFCQALQRDTSDPAGLFLYSNDLVGVMINKFPYNNGHLLIFPRQHCDTLTALEEKEMSALMTELQFAEKALRDLYGPDGLNGGINLGRAGGAGIADHIHFHMLPRWIGDNNFLSTVGNTRLIPEPPETSHQRLREIYSSR